MPSLVLSLTRQAQHLFVQMKKSYICSMLQFPFEIEKIIASIKLILIDLGGETDFHKLFKILYFSDQKHLVKYGRPINGDTYMAMKNGPVPSKIYDILKIVRGDSFFVEDPIEKEKFSTDFEVRSHYRIFLKNSTFDKDIFSQSEIECFEESIEENKALTFEQLTDKSHDLAWNSADEADGMSVIKIAQAGGANGELLNYIRVNLENQNLVA